MFATKEGPRQEQAIFSGSVLSLVMNSILIHHELNLNTSWNHVSGVGAVSFALVITPVKLLRKSKALRNWTYFLLILLTILELLCMVTIHRLTHQDTTKGRCTNDVCSDSEWEGVTPNQTYQTSFVKEGRRLCEIAEEGEGVQT